MEAPFCPGDWEPRCSTREAELLGEISSLRKKNAALAEENSRIKQQNSILIDSYRIAPQEEAPIRNSKGCDLSDLESFMQSQSSDLIAIGNCRNRLLSILSSTLGLVSEQNSLISKYNSAISHLVLLLSSGAGSIESVTAELRNLHLNYDKEVEFISDRCLNPLLSVTDIKSEVSSKEAIDALGMLASMPHDSSARQRLAAFIARSDKKYEKAREESKSQNDTIFELKKQLDSISEALLLSKSEGIGKALERIRVMRKEAGTFKDACRFAECLVKVVYRYCQGQPQTSQSRLCLARIERWLTDRTSDIDVIQEIDFVLGMQSRATEIVGE